MARRNEINAVVSFGALTSKIEKLNDQLVAAHQKRARLVASLIDGGMSVNEVVHLLGLNATRVTVLADLGRSQLINGPEGETGA